MKPSRWFLSGLLLIPFFPLRPCGAMDEAQLAAFREQFQSPDPSARLAAVERFCEAFMRGDRAGVEDEGNVLPVLAILLGDSEEKIRRRAAGCSAVLAYVGTTKLYRSRRSPTDLDGCPAWRDALRTALDDPDDEVRDSALTAFALAFPVPPDVQDALVERYEPERAKNLVMGNKIPYSLLIDNAPTPRATALLERLADEPKMAVQLAQMLRGFGRVPPPSLLPGFVRALRREEEWNRRVALFYAVVEYRQLARPYLDLLREVRRGETFAGNQWGMELAIAGVEQAR